MSIIEAPEACPAAASDEWVSAREASLITGIPQRKIAGAAEDGYLTVRRPLPGSRSLPKYSRSSCLALAAYLTTRASKVPAPAPAGSGEGARP